MRNPVTVFLLGSNAKSVVWADRLSYTSEYSANAFLGMERRMISDRACTQIVFALTAFRKANGPFPDMLKELTPSYLERVPSDAYTGKEFGYTRDGDLFKLDSYRNNGIDDGGNFDLSEDFAFYSPPKTFEEFSSEHSVERSHVERMQPLIEKQE